MKIIDYPSLLRPPPRKFYNQEEWWWETVEKLKVLARKAIIIVNGKVWGGDMGIKVEFEVIAAKELTFQIKNKEEEVLMIIKARVDRDGNLSFSDPDIKKDETISLEDALGFSKVVVASLFKAHEHLNRIDVDQR